LTADNAGALELPVVRASCGRARPWADVAL